MKSARIALCMVATGLLSACAYVPTKEAAARRVSPDYMAVGGVEDAIAFVYGDVTVLEFEDGAPSFLSVTDADGKSVAYEQVGRYYRMPRALDKFTVSANGQTVTFTAPMITRVFSAPLAPTPTSMPPVAQQQVAKLEPLEVPAASPGDKEVIDLLDLCKRQLGDVRRLLDAAGKNPRATGQELFEVNRRLDDIEARMVTAAAAVIRVTFPTGSTAFTPDPDVARVLVSAGKAAAHVNVRGRTDSRVAGAADPRIALGRALAARKYLVSHGVSASKIRVFSLADGDFVAPSVTEEGRALNRRVEIEFINSRIADLRNQSTELAAQQ